MLESIRISDHISLGMVAKTFPLERIEGVLRNQGKRSRRRRDLPAQGMVYYVIAMTLYREVAYREVLRLLGEGIGWALGPQAGVRIAGKAALSRARGRLGWEAVRQLHDASW